MARHLVLAVPLVVLSLASCRAVQPDGPLKDLVDGEIFTGDTRGAPPRHENDVLVEPPDTGGPLRWKMRF